MAELGRDLQTVRLRLKSAVHVLATTDLPVQRASGVGPRTAKMMLDAWHELEIADLAGGYTGKNRRTVESTAPRRKRMSIPHGPESPSPANGLKTAVQAMPGTGNPSGSETATPLPPKTKALTTCFRLPARKRRLRHPPQKPERGHALPGRVAPGRTAMPAPGRSHPLPDPKSTGASACLAGMHSTSALRLLFGQSVPEAPGRPRHRLRRFGDPFRPSSHQATTGRTPVSCPVPSAFPCRLPSSSTGPAPSTLPRRLPPASGNACGPARL